LIDSHTLAKWHLTTDEVANELDRAPWAAVIAVSCRLSRTSPSRVYNCLGIMPIMAVFLVICEPDPLATKAAGSRHPIRTWSI
jgi:hypothetical protein